MKNLLFLMATTIVWVANGGVDVSGTINIHVDADVLTAFVSAFCGVAALVRGVRLCKGR